LGSWHQIWGKKWDLKKKKGVNSTNFANFWEKKTPKFQHLEIGKTKKTKP
jgi:hypothetical protein